METNQSSSNCPTSPNLSEGDLVLFTPLKKSFGILAEDRIVTLVKAYPNCNRAKIRFKNGATKVVVLERLSKAP